MNNYLIKAARCENTPNIEPGSIVAEVLLQDKEEAFYVTSWMFMNFIYFCKSKVPLFEKVMAFEGREMDDEEADHFEEYLEQFAINIGEVEEILKETDDEWYMLYRYLIFAMEEGWNGMHTLFDETVGKFFNSIQIPISEREKDMTN